MDKLFFSIKDAAKVKTFTELYILAFVTTVTNKDPERYCVLTNRMLADVGIPGNTAKRALDNLVKSGLITYEIKLNKRYGTKERRIRRVDQSSKMETCEISKMEYSESSKMDISESSILDAPKFQNGIMESSKMETSSISTKVDLIKVEDQSRVARAQESEKEIQNSRDTHTETDRFSGSQNTLPAPLETVPNSTSNLTALTAFTGATLPAAPSAPTFAEMVNYYTDFTDFALWHLPVNIQEMAAFAKKFLLDNQRDPGLASMPLDFLESESRLFLNHFQAGSWRDVNGRPINTSTAYQKFTAWVLKDWDKEKTNMQQKQNAQSAQRGKFMQYETTAEFVERVRRQGEELAAMPDPLEEMTKQIERMKKHA